jgi:hypothetical protein
MYRCNPESFERQPAREETFCNGENRDLALHAEIIMVASLNNDQVTESQQNKLCRSFRFSHLEIPHQPATPQDSAACADRRTSFYSIVAWDTKYGRDQNVWIAYSTPASGSLSASRALRAARLPRATFLRPGRREGKRREGKRREGKRREGKRREGKRREEKILR